MRPKPASIPPHFSPRYVFCLLRSGPPATIRTTLDRSPCPPEESIQFVELLVDEPCQSEPGTHARLAVADELAASLGLTQRQHTRYGP